MERLIHKAKCFVEADEWDMRQYLSMTPDERRKIAMILKNRVYGKSPESIWTNRAAKKE